MKNPNPQTQQLKKYASVDTAGGTVTVNAKVEPHIKAWLDTLPEGKSYHIRQALRDYYQKHHSDGVVGNSSGAGAE